MSAQTVPLTVAPNQKFSVQLTVNSKPLTLQLGLSYSEMAGYWQMAVYDATGALLIACVPLLTGWWPSANILAQYQYLGIGSAYLLNTGNASIDYPGLNDLGLFTLIWDDNV